MWKKLLSFVIVSSLSVSLVAPIVHAEAPIENVNVIIVFKDKIDKTAIQNVDGEIEKVLNNVSVVTGEVPKDMIDDLGRDKDVLAVEIDQRVQVSGQVQDWGIQTVKAPSAWESQLTGKGLKIAVVDTGITPHKDLMIAGGVSFTPYTPSYVDDNGHGTHVAGIIGAENNDFGVVGVAPDADIYAVKVLDKDGSGNLSDIIKGIDWAITNNMDIINLSLGTQTHSYALKQVVDKAYNNGIVVVAASGNDGNADGIGETVDYPARYDSVIAVAAIDSANNRGAFSSTGAEIEVAAPGVKIASTYLNEGYGIMTGTSMASPYVAGTVALLKQANPTLSNTQLRQKLIESTIDLGTLGRDSFFGFGLVQAPVSAYSQQQPIQEEAVQQPTTTQDQANQQPTQDVVTAPPVQQEPTSTPVTNPAPETKPVQQPVQKPIVVQPKPTTAKKMNATMKTAKSKYKAGNYVYINLKATDQTTKKSIVKGTFKVTIQSPNGKTSVVTVKTNYKGEAVVKWKAPKYAKKGSYKLKMIASASRYSTASATKSISIY